VSWRLGGEKKCKEMQRNCKKCEEVTILFGTLFALIDFVPSYKHF